MAESNTLLKYPKEVQIIFEPIIYPQSCSVVFPRPTAVLYDVKTHIVWLYVQQSNLQVQVKLKEY